VRLTNLWKDPATWLALALCMATVLVYRPGLSGDYMFDDHANLLDNRQLDMAALDLDHLAGAAFSSGAGTLRRPISMASFALNRYFFGISPYSYKVANLCIHLGTGIGLWILGGLVLRSYNRLPGNPLSAGTTRWLPLVVAGLWLVHPLNLSPVLYIVQRMAGLAALFTVTGLCLYLAGRLRLQEGKPGLVHILTGLLLFGSLAVLSKENGILLPLYMLVLEITLFHFRDDNARLQRSVMALFVLLIIIPGILALYYLFTHSATYLNYSGRDFTLTERLLTEPRVLLFYLKLTVMPSVQELGLFHDDIPLSRGLLEPPTTLYAIVALAALFVSALALIRKAPLVSLGILWFFASHALESTIIPLEIAHEHRNYLADYGIILAVAGLMPHVPRRLASALYTALPAVFLCLFGYTTWVRSTQWSDNVDQAVYEVLHHPDSPRALFSAGRIHARLALKGRNESRDKAFAYLQRASRIDRIGIMSDITMIKLAVLLGMPVQPAWYDTVVNKLTSHPLTPSDIASVQDLADCAGDSCRIPDEEMQRIFTAALRNENSRIMTVYGFYSINRNDDFHKGLELFNRAVKLDPKEPQYWKNLVNLLMVMARPDEAEQRLHEFESLNLVGVTNSDYQALQDDIDKARLEHSLANDKHPEQNGS
jgi:protein O-mannosyl-transferase